MDVWLKVQRKKVVIVSTDYPYWVAFSLNDAHKTRRVISSTMSHHDGSVTKQSVAIPEISKRLDYGIVVMAQVAPLRFATNDALGFQIYEILKIS